MRAGKLAFYVGTCGFPGLSKVESRDFEKLKKRLKTIGVAPLEHDKCNDIANEARRMAAYVEGYNVVTGREISRRFGKKWAQ